MNSHYLARVYYDYCVDMEYLKDASQFVHLNCAEYADNPELLSSILFGYKRGTFTGAATDREGLFDQANNGMLFLDEVHRLDAKGQEKLFEYLDNGVISPIGDTDPGHSVNVRLIFATTEDISSTFLQTFIRRIPVQIDIPSLSERPPYEREELAKLFLLQQAKHIRRCIQITKQILTAITSNEYESNVGQLKNDVTLTVANALSRQNASDVDRNSIDIEIRDLPSEIWQGHSEAQRISLLGDKTLIMIRPDMRVDQLSQVVIQEENQIRDAFLRILRAFRQSKNEGDFYDTATDIIQTLCDQLIYDQVIKRGELPLKLFQEVLQFKLLSIEQDDDIEFSGNVIVVLAYFFYYRQFNYWILSSDDHRALTYLTNRTARNYPKVSQLADEILTIISDSLSASADVVDRLFLQLYLRRTVKVNRSNLLRCIILSHGYSTASSIANVVNRMLKHQVVDFIDMPLDIATKEIGQQVKAYVTKRKITSGLILMVDMGSLRGIHRYLGNNIDYPIGILSNVSTQSALMVGDMILNHTPINKIVEQTKGQNWIEGQVIYPEKTKKNLIVTCCSTGIGTAKQIKKLLDASIPSRFEVVVNAYEYASLHSSQQIELLERTYNVLTVVGTVDPEIPNLQYIPLEKIILGEDIDKLNDVLKPIASNNEISSMVDTILHNFTIERVINSLTILDARAVMDSIDVALGKYNSIAPEKLSNRTRMALYVHVSCLIERLIRNEPIMSYEWDQENVDTTIISSIKQAFSVMETQYSVKIPDSEYGYIYDIIRGNQ